MNAMAMSPAEPAHPELRRGFSLIELSVVLVIIGILIYMTLATGAQQLEIARIKQTKYKLQKIQSALAIYLATYGHLPCPADGTLPKTDPAFGTQAGYSNPSNGLGDAACDPNKLLTDPLPYSVYIGVVPTAELGMGVDSMMDGWGNRMTYLVSRNCVDPDNWNAANTYKCSNQNTAANSGSTTQNGGNVVLRGKNGQTWQDQAAYLVISHGHYGYGAYSGQGGPKQQITAPVSYYEYRNGNLQDSGPNIGSPKLPHNGSVSYYELPLNDGDIAGNYFDNLTAWATAPQIYYNGNH